MGSEKATGEKKSHLRFRDAPPTAHPLCRGWGGRRGRTVANVCRKSDLASFHQVRAVPTVPRKVGGCSCCGGNRPEWTLNGTNYSSVCVCVRTKRKQRQKVKCFSKKQSVLQNWMQQRKQAKKGTSFCAGLDNSKLPANEGSVRAH